MTITPALKPARWRFLAGGLVATAIVAVLIAIVLSPLLFAVVERRTSRWAELANVGNAYGGVAAVLSGLALLGVTLSLLLQYRQTRSDRIISLRQLHLELVKLGIDEPSLMARNVDTSTSLQDTARLNAYVNLWVGHWAMLWDLRQLDEGHLRRHVAEFFTNPAARQWWHQKGPTWSTKLTSRRLRFQTIIGEECTHADQRAVSRPPVSLAARRPVTTSPAALKDGRIGYLAAMIAGAALAVAVDRILRPPRKSSGRRS